MGRRMAVLIASASPHIYRPRRARDGGRARMSAMDAPRDALTVRAPLVAYVRVSKKGDREGDRFRSPTEQADRARSHAESRGWAVGEVIEDMDVSGATHPEERPGMARALELIRRGRAGGLVAHSLDRLSRDPGHGDWLVQEVTAHNGVVTAPDMPEDITSPTGEFTFGMLLGVARLYRRTAGQRFQQAQERATLAGIPHGRIPFGYRQLPDRTIEPDPELVPLVRGLFEGRIHGHGWGHLATVLSEETGRPWSRRGVQHVVGNQLYRTGRIASGVIVSEVEAGAIVDEATWHAAQAPRGVRDGRTDRASAPLAGLLKCAACGYTLVHWRPSAKQAGTAPRYRCQGLHCPARVTVHAPTVESLVVAEAFAVDLKLVAQPQRTADLEPLEEALVLATRRFDQVQMPDAMDALGDAWASAAKSRREERDAAARALGEARAEAGVSSEGGSGGAVLRLGHIWDDLEPAQQREALRWIFEEVRVRKVPRLQPPSLEFKVRATRPWGVLEYRPSDIERS